jgi:hypothetical protein
MAEHSGRPFVRRVRLVATVGAVLFVLVAGVSCGDGSSAASSSGAAAERGVAAAPGSGDTLAGPAPAAKAPDQGAPAQPLDTERAVVRTASLGIEAADVPKAVAQVRAIAQTAQGLVAEESQYSGSGAAVTVRVPAPALDRVMDEVSALGTVTQRRTQATDVTDQMVDLDARVASQQASVDRVRALLARAESIGDIASIESQLSQREGELDSLKNRLASLKGKVALSTLSVTIDGPGMLPPPAEPPGFLAGIAAGWESMIRVLVVVGAVLGFLIPYLPLVAVVLALGWAVRRAARRRTPALATAPAGAGQSGPGTEGDS